MRKLTIYRSVVLFGRTICLVILTGFANAHGAQSPSSAYFYHPESSSTHEYYNIPSDSAKGPIPQEKAEGRTSINSSPSEANRKPQAIATPPVSPSHSKPVQQTQPVFSSPFKKASEPQKTETLQSYPEISGPGPSISPQTSQPITQTQPAVPTAPQPSSQTPKNEPAPQTPPKTQIIIPAEMPGESSSSTAPQRYQYGSQLPSSPMDPSAGPLSIPQNLQESPEEVANETYIINFNNVSIIEYIRFISKISNTNFLFNETDLQFNVTIISEEPTSIENIMSALIQILRIHGFNLFEQGNNLVIYRNADLSKISTVVTEDGQPFTAPIITRVIRLNYVSPDKVKAIIQPMLSAQALIEVSPETRHIIVTDLATNIDKVLLLLHSLDIPHNSIEVSTYYTQYTVASNLIGLAEQILAPIALADGSPITLVPQSSTNTIFIVSTPDLINRTISVLQALDRPGVQENQALPRSAAIEIGNYVAQNVAPSALIPLAEKILNPIAQAENVLLNLVQQPSTNTIFIISTPEVIQRALTVLRSLDQSIPIPANTELPPPPPPDIPSTDMEGTVLYLYKLQYLKGEKIEIALQDIGDSLLRTGLANADIVSTINSMQWIEPNNSLLFVGTPAAIEKIKEFLRVLDKPLRQVFLEVLVIETTLANSMTFGVQWGTNGINGQTFFGNSGLFDSSGLFTPNFVFPQVNNIPGVVQPNLQLEQGFNFGVIGDVITHNGNVFASIGALLKALQVETQTRILLNPKIVTEDNNTAQVFVGQNIPFTTANVQIQAANASTGFNIDYRDIGVLLEVTPFLGSNDIVTLDLHQEINTLPTDASANGTSPNIPSTINNFPIPTTNKVLTTTRVHVPHNYFLIISGQIQDQKVYVRSGLPCLGCLPVVGAAFSQQSTVLTKQNIIIFIHPKIIDNRYDIAELTDEQGCDFERHSEAHYQGHKTPCGRYLREEPCVEPPYHPAPRYPIGYCPGPCDYPDYPCCKKNKRGYPGDPGSYPSVVPCDGPGEIVNEIPCDLPAEYPIRGPARPNNGSNTGYYFSVDGQSSPNGYVPNDGKMIPNNGYVPNNGKMIPNGYVPNN